MVGKVLFQNKISEFKQWFLTIPLYVNKYLRYEKRRSRTTGQRPYGNE